MALYDQVAEIYDQSYDRPICEAENNVVISRLNQLLRWDDDVLDVGCGTGFLLEQRYIPVISYAGIDISAGMLQKAIKKFPHHHFYLGSMDNMLMIKDSSFDITACLFGSFNYCDQPAQAAKEMYRVLKPGGRLFLVACGPRYTTRESYIMNRHGIKTPMKCWSRNALAGCFYDAGFQDIDIKGVNALGDKIPLPTQMLTKYLKLETCLADSVFPNLFYYLVVTGTKHG